MRTMRLPVIPILLLAASLTASAAQSTPTPPAPKLPKPKPGSTSLTTEESAAQTEFKKAMASPEKAVRRAAVPLLANSWHLSSWQLLATVATSDTENAVRADAMRALAHQHAHDDKLAHLLVQCFNSVKPTNPELSSYFGQELGFSEFKYEAANALQDAMGKLRVQDKVYGANDAELQLNLAAARKRRKHFDDLLKAFNKLTQSDIDTAVDAPVKVKKWWEENSAKVGRLDQELAAKYKAEDVEAAKNAK